jgi:Yip1 domain
VNLAARIWGVIRRPRSTMSAVLREPRWAAVLLVATVVPAAAGAVLFSTDVGQQALVDQWERTAFAFGQPVDDAQYARMHELSARGPLYAVGTAVLSGPLLTVAVAAGLFGLFRGRRPDVAFRTVLAVVAHAGLILALRQTVAAPLGYVRETTASATSLGVWFPMFDEAAPAARFFGVLDLFVIWWCVVLAVGTGAAYGRPARALAPVLVGAYVAVAVVLAVVMAVTGGTA